MTSSPWLLLSIYSAAIVAASLLGGWLPGRVHMTHTRTQLIMSLVAGLMLGIALYHLLPHGVLQLREGADEGTAAIERAVWWMMLGMIAMLLLLRLFRFHQHDFSAEERIHHDGPHALSWLGIALGLGLHALIEGAALGASIASGFLPRHAGGAVGFAGLGVFLAILLHKPLDALSITSLMKTGGWAPRSRWVANACFALLCPLGALLFFLGVNQPGVAPVQAQAVGAALAFAAGVFLCISLGDLLPEVHFHSHDRVKLTLALLLGIGIAYGLRYLEPSFLHSLETAPL